MVIAVKKEHKNQNEKENTEVVIIGSGAIGMLIATRLSSKGISCLLLSIRDLPDYQYSENTEMEIKCTIKLEKGLKEEVVKVNRSHLNNYRGTPSLFIITAKTFVNEYLARKIIELNSEYQKTPVVLLQNGIGIEQPFVDFEEIYLSALYIPAMKISNTEVTAISEKVSLIGPSPKSKKREKAAEIAQLLDSENFRFQTSVDFRKQLWTKVALNTVVNSICAIANATNGIFTKSEYAREIAKKGLKEIADVVEEIEGIILNTDEMFARILEVAKSAKDHSCSTLQDLKRNQRTEIDHLNLGIVQIAEKNLEESKVETVETLGLLVKMLEP